MIDALGSVLSFFYQFTHSFGFAIILLTVLIRLVLFPLTMKQTRSMQGMARLQPEVKKLQAEFGHDKQQLNAEMMALYKKEKINPAAGCLPLLLQIPVFIGLYRVIRGLTNTSTMAFSQVRVSSPSYLSKSSEMYRSIVDGGGKLKSFGINLAETASSVTGGLGTRLPYLVLVLGIAATGFAQQIRANQLNPATTAQAATMQKVMKILPIGFAAFCFQAQAGLVLYWLASNLWTLAQQEVLHKTNPSPALAQVEEVTAPKGAVAQAKAKLESLEVPDGKGKTVPRGLANPKPVATPPKGKTSSTPIPTKSAKANSNGASKAPKNQRKGR